MDIQIPKWTYSSLDPEAAGIRLATTYPIECKPSKEREEM
jgi:hypothetical protein